MPDEAADAAGHCAALVRLNDPDRYLATLFAPAAARPALFALYAFSDEIARVRDHVSAPMPGAIRLQWWRDVLTSPTGGDGGGHPVARDLLAAIGRYHLPRQAFINLIDAREFDLFDDPMPTGGELDGYLGETASAVIRLATIVLADGADPGGADAAGHAGLAVGLTGLLRAFPFHAARGQIVLPMDALTASGVTREDVVSGRGGPGLLAAMADLRGTARAHLAAFERSRPTLPRAIRPAFLPTALVPGYLSRMSRRGFDPYRTPVDRPVWAKIAILWRERLR